MEDAMEGPPNVKLCINKTLDTKLFFLSSELQHRMRRQIWELTVVTIEFMVTFLRTIMMFPLQRYCMSLPVIFMIKLYM